MIITENFSFIHMPKIGGSFVEEILCASFGRGLHKHTVKKGRIFNQVYNFFITVKPFCYWAVGPQILLRGYAELLKHGFADELPSSKKNQLVLGVYRHPLDRYISQYEFRWHARSGQTHIRSAEIQKKYPAWPANESFRENFEIRNEFFTLFQTHLPLSDRVGIQTEELISYFCKNPADLLSSGCKGLTIQKVVNAMYDVRFLRMESLNEEMALFLQNFHLSKEKISWVQRHERVLPGSKGREIHGNFSDYYDSELLEMANHKERIALFFWSCIESGCRTREQFRLAALEGKTS